MRQRRRRRGGAGSINRNHIFVSDDDLRVKLTEGPRVTTFRFISPSGSVFDYSVEEEEEEDPSAGNDDDVVIGGPIDGSDGARPLRATGGADDPYGGQILLEIASASGFDDDVGFGRPNNGPIFVRYEVSLPGGWSSLGPTATTTAVRDEDDDAARSSSSGGGRDGTGEGEGEEDDDYAARVSWVVGTTRSAWPDRENSGSLGRLVHRNGGDAVFLGGSFALVKRR